MTEIALVSLAVLAGAAAAVRLGRKPAVVAGATVASVCVAAVALWTPTRAPEPLAGATMLLEAPGEQDGSYRSSESCRPCHPAAHASWSRSYHRSMTQIADETTALADFGDVTLLFDGRPYRLYRRLGQPQVELLDPDEVDKALELAQAGDVEAAQQFAQTIPTVSRPIVATTGSHHYQLYWYPSGRGDELYMLPFAWLIEERRWLPRVSVFLTPPNQLEPRKVWNRDCLPCHSTGGAPGYDPGGAGEPQTHLAEAGIACEACHGPGDVHARENRDPLRRYALHLSDGDDETVVNPMRLAGQRASQVCGQCHSLNTQYDGEAWAGSFVDGLPYRPGEDLTETVYVVSPDTLERSPLMQDFVRQRPGTLDEWFWSDGEIRVVGREYNGLVESPCYGGGEFGCLSCHSMHDAAPDDQLKPGMRGDAACLQCHADFETRVAEHSHHPAGSAGARCQSCHMPHTSYGLLKASRSHRVTSPSVSVNISTGRPNACNLCHLDRPLGWTAEALEEWYGIDSPELGPAERETPAGALWMLTGDAGLRAIAVWHVGREEVLETSGTAWLPPAMAPLLDDPYDAVRWIAAKSLRTLPGYAAFEYDFLAPPAERAAAARRVLEQWRPEGRELPPALFEPDGSPRAAIFRSLLENRDDRPIYLVE